MDFIEEMKNKVLRGEQIDREEALRLSEEPSDRLREAAEEIRSHAAKYHSAAFSALT